MTQITIDVDVAKLGTYEDSYVATLFHAVQASSAHYADSEMTDLVTKIRHEIVRRWLRSVQPEMYHHQERAYTQYQLTRFAKWNGEDWVPKTPDDEPDVMHLALHGESVKCGRPTGKRTRWAKEVNCTDCNETEERVA